MASLDPRKYLFDILQACELLVKFTTNKSLAEDSADSLLRSAVERQFEIIGEALAQAIRVEPGLFARITDARRIVAFRNRLIHGYDSLADDIVWGVLESNLPTLHREVQSLLDELSTESI
jgi:uncharacterized protein with HEPN domain